MTDKRVHENEWEVDSVFVQHERLFPSVKVCFKSDFLLSCLANAVAATREASCVERPDTSLGCVVFSVATVPGGHEE